MLRNSTIDLLGRLGAARSAGEIWSAAAEHLSCHGLTHSIYIYVDATDPTSTQVWSSLPDEWNEHYRAQRYDLIDPFLRYCCRDFQTVATGAEYLRSHPFLNSIERRIIQEASEAGFRAGFSSPVSLLSQGGIGGWNFGSSLRRKAFSALKTELGDTLRLDGFFIHAHLRRLAGQTARCEPSPRLLSPRERECLLWLARGLRTGQIADRLDIAEITVALHIRHARAKLSAATREQAVARAILAGEIDP